MPFYYKILDVSNDHVWEEQSGDGNWYIHDGTNRANTCFPTLEAARQICMQYPGGPQRWLRIVYFEGENG